MGVHEAVIDTTIIYGVTIDLQYCISDNLISLFRHCARSSTDRASDYGLEV